MKPAYIKSISYHLLKSNTAQHYLTHGRTLVYLYVAVNTALLGREPFVQLSVVLNEIIIMISITPTDDTVQH